MAPYIRLKACSASERRTTLKENGLDRCGNRREAVQASRGERLRRRTLEAPGAQKMGPSK